MYKELEIEIEIEIDLTLEMFLESLKLSDPFFLNFIRRNLSREFEVKNLKHG